MLTHIEIHQIFCLSQGQRGNVSCTRFQQGKGYSHDSQQLIKLTSNPCEYFIRHINCHYELPCTFPFQIDHYLLTITFWYKQVSHLNSEGIFFSIYLLNIHVQEGTKSSLQPCFLECFDISFNTMPVFIFTQLMMVTFMKPLFAFGV